MKRKNLAALMLVCVLAAVPALAFGAGSSSNSSGGSTSGTITAGTGSTVAPGPTNTGTVGNNTAVTVDENGIQTTGASTAPSQSGDVLAVVINGSNAAGQTMTVDPNGNAVIGGSTVVVVGKTEDGSKTAGLPEAVVAQFNEFDTTKSMTSVLPQTAGYAVQDDININLYDIATGAALANTPRVVPIKWSGLTAAKADLLIGFYDNATNTYTIAEIVSINYDTQEINIRVNGSGTARILSR